MPVPDLHSLLLPLLRLTSDGEEHSIPDLREQLAVALNLSSDDLARKLPSGSQSLFANRVAWGAIYLHRAEALEYIKRGVFRISAQGQSLLDQNLAKITVQTLSRYPAFASPVIKHQRI